MNSHTLHHTSSDPVSVRATELAVQFESEVCRRTDRHFAILLIIQWMAYIGLAMWLSPQTWVGASSQIHPHLIAALMLGAIINIAPITLVIILPGAVLTRHVIAISQALSSGLLIHLTDGRIETHFHVFGSLAFLSFYRDWRVLITASSVVAVDHLLRGWYLPLSIYGAAVPTLIRSLEYAGWVVFEDVFLILSIFEARRATRNVGRNQAEAEFANKAKTTLLANMSHELRTPLNGILGMNQLLLGTELSVRQQHLVNSGEVSGRHLVQLIDKLLDVAHLDAGELKLVLADVPIGKMVDEVITTLSHRAERKGLSLAVHVHPDARVTARCDQFRLKQILLNLLENAIKFTESGVVTLNVHCHHVDGNRVALRFTVNDTGIGISPEQQCRLFTSFRQLETSFSRRFGGNGLGLSICKNLVELMGGTIGVQSQIGEGSTFSIDVPLDLSIEQNGTTTTQKRLLPMKDNSDLLAGHILVVEDNHMNQLFISELLKHFGCTCDLVANGNLALAALQDKSYDVVLMDCQMPEMDGLTATREIRERQKNGRYSTNRIPIIALTANALRGDRERCLDAGMDDYLSKPTDGNQLQDVLRKYLGVSKQPVVFTSNDPTLVL